MTLHKKAQEAWDYISRDHGTLETVAMLKAHCHIDSNIATAAIIMHAHNNEAWFDNNIPKEITEAPMMGKSFALIGLLFSIMLIILSYEYER